MTEEKNSKDELNELFHQWCEQTIAGKDISRLAELLQSADEKGELPRLMKKAYLQIRNEPFFSPKEKKHIFRNSVKVLPPAIGKRRKIIYRISAAAAVLLFAGSGYFLYQYKNHPNNHIADIAEKTAADLNAPTKYCGLLNIENGKKISFNNEKEGKIATEGNIQITKQANGNLSFSGNAAESVMNTLTVPKGSKPMRLLLADGTSILLNVASTLTFPNAFTENERRVTLNGEAYFEVKHDEKHPFIVETGKNEIKVLGTHFNVCAYKDDSSVKVTLVEGKVDVNDNIILKPGQQAVIEKNIAALNTTPNMQSELAWTNDEFNFDGESLAGILSALSKWYNFTVEYKSTPPQGHFSGVFNKNDSLSKILKIMESYGLHFKIENNKLIVL